MPVHPPVPLTPDSENRIDVQWSGTDVAIVRLLGEHDMASAGELEQTLRRLARCGESIVVDLTETTFADSSILHALISADTELRRRGQGFALHVATAAIVRKALDLTGLLDRLDHASTRQQAIELARSFAKARHY
jgi:anti-sigma B factor antagonist